MNSEALTAAFSPTPSLQRAAAVQIGAAAAVPKSATAVGVPVGASGRVGAELGLDRGRLEAAGFDGSVGSILVVPSEAGATTVAVGVGEPGQLDVAALRNAAAAFARSAALHAADRIRPRRRRAGARAGGPGRRRGSAAGSLPLRPAAAPSEGHDVSRLTVVADAGDKRRSPPAPNEAGRWPRRRSWRAILPTPRTATQRQHVRRRGAGDRCATEGSRSRCSTRTSWSRWAAAGCSASTLAAPSRRG